MLEADSDTASVVRRIFEMFDAGTGYRTIANVLEREGLPSPGEVGPNRHPRSAGVWGGSAVRAILTNPRYPGHQVVGRQRRRDELHDPMDPASGTTSRQRRQRWQPTGNWVTSDEPAWPALVDEDLWERANARTTNNGGPPRLVHAGRSVLVTEHPSVTYGLLATARGQKEPSVRQWVRRIRNSGRLTTVELDGTTLVPSFQFDDTYEPIDEVGDVVARLTTFGMSPWAVWRWFTVCNPWTEEPVGERCGPPGRSDPKVG